MTTTISRLKTCPLHQGDRYWTTYHIGEETICLNDCPNKICVYEPTQAIDNGKSKIPVPDIKLDRPRRCPRCNQLLTRGYGILQCISCGWEVI